jgi:Low-density lipoprotein receptor repeat class B
VDSSHIYWTDGSGGTVMAASLDGSGVTTLVSGQSDPIGVTVGPQ